ncbi:cobyrinate a,c-diamide synthase [Rhodothalassium salexigens]|uniref:cobyrinate a,c-diamide synthase n=1 Tax=Rhodothalassium salexigens TaxID=1086 RepID=UPI003B8A6B11
MPPGLLVSAPGSGRGKTTLTLGLLRAFTRAGVTVQPFKTGPDYIDPAFHRAAAGRASFNLDGWAMAPPLLNTIAGQAQGADLIVAEGAMGLFDGAGHQGVSDGGSSADMAQRFGWPVVLVLDVSAQAQSAAATAWGFAHCPGAPRLAGVVLNRVAGARHEALVRAGLDAMGLPVLGALPRRADLSLPERHLGLVQAGERADLDATLDRLADFVAAHVDLDAVRAAARGEPGEPDAPGVAGGSTGSGTGGEPRSAGARAAGWPPPPAACIALARDAAFSFTYPHLVAAWRAQGAEVRPFSPLADEPPAADADLVWLPGGYPELHAGRLAAASRFLDGLRAHARTRPVHGECGGYMVLGQGLVDADGRRHAMAGLLGLVTSFEQRRLSLGYRRATLRAAMPGHGAGAVLSGHEFHYATIVDQPDPPLAHVTGAAGVAVDETGSTRGRVTGSFFHLIAEIQP